MVRVMQLGEALAEVTSARRDMGPGLAMAIVRQTAEQNPDETTREKCFACLAAFLQRLGLLALFDNYHQTLDNAQNLLHIILPYVSQKPLLPSCSWLSPSDECGYELSEAILAALHIWKASKANMTCESR